jgi:hypothetical protein
MHSELSALRPIFFLAFPNFPVLFLPQGAMFIWRLLPRRPSVRHYIAIITAC